jgi:hypothetical protein
MALEAALHQHGPNALLKERDVLGACGGSFELGFVELAVSVAIELVEHASRRARIVLVVSLSNSSDQPVSVDVAAVDGTATAASADYGSFPTFNPGDPLTQTVTLNVLPDSTVEPDEMFTVQLSNAVGANASIADRVAVVTILNDDSTRSRSATCGEPKGPAGPRCSTCWSA